MNNKEIHLFEKQKAMYQSLTEEQLKIVDEYLVNDMRKLKKICNPLLHHKGTPEIYYEDLYGVATDVLIESLDSFDANRKCSFNTFFVGNVKRAFYDWIRDSTRLCRCNIQTDATGKIVRDKDGNVVIIPNIPLDAPAEDGTDMKEKIASDFRIEDNLSEEIGFSNDDKIIKYLSRLSKRQRKIVMLLSDGYSQDEISKLLHISKKEYADNLLSIRAYENIRILL